MPARTTRSCRRRGACSTACRRRPSSASSSSQIDGMGTSNRSKAFHDVAWKNIGDAGFPDRILWHKAVAAKYPSYDISQVGIYGGSAGGQNAMGALLFHPEFYKVAVSFAGCHDNRMDKIWWNEQWMGWPHRPAVRLVVERRQRVQAAGETAAARRRAGQERRSVVDAAGGERADQGEQDVRLLHVPRRRPRGGSARRAGAVRRSQAVGLLRSPPARCRAAGLERRQVELVR